MRQATFSTLPSSLWLITGALLSTAVLLPDLALAQYNSPLGNAVLPHVRHVRVQLPAVAYGIAGVTILGVAAAALFGRFQWGWLFAIIGSLALVAAESHLAGGGATEMGDVTRYVSTEGTDNKITRDSQALAVATAERSRWIGYAIGGLGAMGLAAVAVLGRFRWGWLFGICGGLMILAGYVGVSSYLTTTEPFPDGLAADQAAMGLADGSADAALFDNSTLLAANTANNTRQVTYGLAGLGIIGLGVMAMLCRFQWRWVFAVVGGLLVLAGLNQGLQYITG